ncbi:GNAT family N-acetyltransferase [Hahella sp. CCB-MM4]|uniref:GNAT family N-acetyltransferase n=1 Tax=Hahella sp. (strain CCB-MM4) TaxID=1926491 RepID=UPI000B9C2448|nr:GNAT family N-acetyltransferase [Hahella sp. CCB-MM4]OZG72996.1 GNAT family N-acetyltransferase [Hahella sp. CCB-MM4]
MEIKIDDLTGPEVAGLLNEHMQEMKRRSPPESIHALDLEGLKKPEITFWSAWEGDLIIGCGALKELDASHAEIKSMRTAEAYQRKGIARQMLQHLLDEAKKRNYARLSLETGSQASFEPARQLYAGFGFEYCGPFAGYKDDPNSVFMTRAL